MEITESGINRLLFIAEDEPTLLQRLLGEEIKFTSLNHSYTSQPKELEALYAAKVSLASIKKKIAPVALEAVHGPLLTSENDFALIAERLGLYYGDLSHVERAHPGDVILVYPDIYWTHKTHAEQNKFMNECKVLLIYVGEKVPTRLLRLEKGVEWQARPTPVHPTSEQKLLAHGKPISVFDLFRAHSDGLKVNKENASEIEAFVRACPAFKGGSISQCADLVPYAENPLVQAVLKTNASEGDTPLAEWLHKLLKKDRVYKYSALDSDLLSGSNSSGGGVHFPRLGSLGPYFLDIRRERDEPHLSGLSGHAHLILPPNTSKEESCSDED